MNKQIEIMTRQRWRAPAFLILALCAAAAGCNMTRIAAKQTTAVMILAAPTYDRESDLVLAEQASASNLKMMEGLLEVTPDDADLLLLTSGSFTRYAFGFIEEEVEIADEQYDFERKAAQVKRAVDFYARGREYGMRWIALHQDNFPAVVDQDLDRLAAELQEFKKEDVPGLFWTAYAWGSIINLQQSEPARLAELSKVELMMERVMELDEAYFFGGSHLFYGTFYGSRPEMLGGDPARSKRHLLRAIEITGGRYLMARYLLAKCYAVQTQDRELFEITLREILEAPPDLYPEQRLANELAKRRARRLLERIDDLFFLSPWVLSLN